MVSSACPSPCATTITSKGNYRMLNIDFSKDYGKSLQVETSVEYDLPSHIYPPKGSEPILMIHPAYSTPSRAKRSHSTSTSPVGASPSNGTPRPLSALQLHGNQPGRNISKANQFRGLCTCGNPHCKPSSANRPSVVRNSQTSRHISQIPENMLYNPVKKLPSASELENQKQLELRKSQLQEQVQAHQKQLQIQVQLQQQRQNGAAKFQTQQLLQLQAQQQKKTSSRSLEQTTWNNIGTKCQGACCQLGIIGSSLVPSQVEFLAPGLPPSLLSRTPTRGPAGSSPKLRVRSRRGLASTVNHPEYLGSARSSRATSVGGVAGSNHTRTRSASMLMGTSAPISAHQVASALDVVRALTPRSLFPKVQHQLQTSANTLFSTVGQCRDSGCSLSAENPIISNANGDKSQNIEWTWSVVDSGFCTPVDSIEDQVMEPLNPNSFSTSHPVPSLSNQKEKHASTLTWIKNFASPLTPCLSANSVGLHNPFVSQTNHPYLPQPIWNLAY